MQGVLAKFYIAEVTKFPGGGGRVKLSAASRGARNAEWASATPAGSMELTINNEPALDFYAVLVERARASGSAIPPEVMIQMVPADDGLPGDGHDFEPIDLPGHYNHGRCAACGLGKDDLVNAQGYFARESDEDTRPAHPNG
jgi:hypothetical protein